MSEARSAEVAVVFLGRGCEGWSIKPTSSNRAPQVAKYRKTVFAAPARA
jgi:hypothetical protein